MDELKNINQMLIKISKDITEIKNDLLEFKFESKVNFSDVNLNIKNLATESRSYFKRLEDKSETLEYVVGQLAYRDHVKNKDIKELKFIINKNNDKGVDKNEAI